MDKPGIWGAGQGDAQRRQTERMICNLDELELYFHDKSPLSAEIKRHLDDGCPRCSSYLELRKKSKASAVGVLDNFWEFVDQDARADYPRLYETLNRLQNTDDPVKRQAAARLRYALNVPVIEIEFRADREQLHYGFTAEIPVSYKEHTLFYDLTITSFDKNEGEVALEFRVELPDLSGKGKVPPKSDDRPGPSIFAAELLLEDSTRLPLRRQRQEAEEGITETWCWVSPRITTNQLPTRAGECFIRIEAFALKAAPVSAAPTPNALSYDI